MARTKKEEVVVEETAVTTEEVVVSEVRDDAFYAKHTGAQDNVIYG